MTCAPCAYDVQLLVEGLNGVDAILDLCVGGVVDEGGTAVLRLLQRAEGRVQTGVQLIFDDDASTMRRRLTNAKMAGSLLSSAGRPLRGIASLIHGLFPATAPRLVSCLINSND